MTVADVLAEDESRSHVGNGTARRAVDGDKLAKRSSDIPRESREERVDDTTV